MPEPRLSRGRGRRRDYRTRCSPRCSSRALDAGEESVKRGPELLPVLREAGVVDAGGYGLTVMFAGVVAALRGDDAAAARAPRCRRASRTPSTTPRPTATARTSRSRAQDLEPGRWVGRLEALGDSVLVVGDAHDAQGAPAHRRPGGGDARCSTAARWRLAPRRRRHATQRCAERLASAWRETHRPAACSRSSPATAWPSCSALARRRPARRRRHAEPLHLRAAGGHPRRPRRGGRRAAELAERDHGRRARRRALGQDVRVVPSRSSRRGSSRRSRSTRTAAPRPTPRRWTEALRHVRTGAVTEAARDDAAERPARFRRGDSVGFVDERARRLGRARRDAARRCSARSPGRRAGHADRRRRRAARPGRGRRARARRGRARVLLRRPAELLVADRGGVS